MEKLIKPACVIFVLFVALMFTCSIGSIKNLDYVKERADDRWAELGFNVVGYDGYNWGYTWWLSPSHGGAKVWYVLERNPDNGITYTGFLSRWGDEIHMYNLTALDAIKPE
jgi:hypothetical protein